MINIGVQKKDENVVKRTHPITDLVSGWYFCIQEQSANVYFVEGIDLWGRSISHTGTDPKQLLETCVSEAKAILNT